MIDSRWLERMTDGFNTLAHAPGVVDPTLGESRPKSQVPHKGHVPKSGPHECFTADIECQERRQGNEVKHRAQENVSRP